MESKVNYLLVGIFVLVLGAALIMGVLWFSVGGFYKSYDRYLVYTRESVSGLSVDSRVTFNGVDVGRVIDISVLRDDPERVRLLLEVEERTPVKTDTQAMLRMQGLTGLLTVDLVGSSQEAPPVEPRPGRPYPVIESRPSLMANLEENVSELLFQLKNTATALNSLLNEENREALSRTLAHLEQLTGTLAGEAPRAAAGVRDLSTTLQNARQASEGLPRLVEEFRAAAQALEAMGGQMARAGNLLETQVEANAGDVRRFTRDTLPQASALVDELYATARNLRELSETLRQNPSSIIYGAPSPAPGPGE